MNILAIARQSDFSPNHVGNDAAILQAVAAELQAAGHTVVTVAETDFAAMSDAEALHTAGGDALPRAVFHMARRADVLRRLEAWAAQGVAVINPPQGVAQCGREAMTLCLTRAGVPHPDSCCLTTAEPWFALHPEWQNRFPGWLKRGDFHAIHREDVSYVANTAEADQLLAEYRRRGIERVVYNQHLHGDLVKFYGVSGTDFFSWFYPMRTGHSKFGLEQRNDSLAETPFVEADLQTLCNRAAQLLGVSVYGGDCIVAADGTCRIIDFNDWPSFAPCRAEAARAIAQLIAAQLI
jgi:hypothetical protein